MGFNTTIVLLNDQFHEYERHPERLISEIREVMSMRRTDRGGPMIFGATHHADHPSLIQVGGNLAVVLAQTGQYGSGMLDQRTILLREAADALGYKLIRKSRKKGESKVGERVP